MAFYEVNESVLEPRAVFGTDLSTVQALVAKNGAPVVARDAGTTTMRTLYPTASGGAPLSQPILTVNGRIEAYVQGETPVDFVINYGQANAYVQRWTPPQKGGAELAYAEVATDVTGITATADITGAQIAFTVTSRPVMVTFLCPVLTLTGTAGQTGVVVVKITDTASTPNELARGSTQLTVGDFGQAVAMWRIGVPGPYTVKGRASAGNQALSVLGTNGVSGGNQGRALLFAEER